MCGGRKQESQGEAQKGAKRASEGHGRQEFVVTTIVTLALDEQSQSWFDAMREAYYPPALNRIGAHLSLFHALPGDGSIRHVLSAAAQAQSPFPMRVVAVRSMGRGVMYALEGAPLSMLHRALADEFRTFLTPQDKQPLRPHVVVQNKVEPAEAKALLALLQAGFTPRSVEAVGLDWWEYLGGPWRLLERFQFRSGPGLPANGQASSATCT